MSELLKKYESLDQTKLNEGTIKILNRVKTITADFTADDAKNNKIAEDVLNEVMKKNPNAVKIVNRTPKAKTAPKKTHKATHTTKATRTTSSTAKSSNNIMSVAKEIQKAGESWKDAMERAKQVLKERKEGVVAKKKTELEKLYALVKTKKELQGFANSDIERDSVRESKVKGSRVVTREGFTSNQYAKNVPNKLGRKYWETRENRSDRLAPNYQKDFPLLASGGVLPDEYVRVVRFADGNYRVEKKTKQNDFGRSFNDVFGEVVKAEVFAKKISENNKIKYIGVDTTPYDFVKRNKMAHGGSTQKYKVGQKFYDTRYDRTCEIVPSSYDGLVTWKRYNKSGTEFENDTQHSLVENQFDYLVNMGAYQLSKQSMANGGSVNMNKHVWEGWTVGRFIEDLEPQFNQIMSGGSWQKPFKTKEEVKAWCMDNQPYYKKNIPEVVNYFWAKVQSKDNYAHGGGIDGGMNNLTIQNVSFAKGGSVKKVPAYVKRRLEELREEIRAERISYGELAELQSLAQYIDPNDVELLEPAGVPEFEEDDYAHGGSVKKVPAYVKRRLEELREEIRAERISYGELAELQSLAKYIDPNDVELLEPAGVPEFDEDDDNFANGGSLPYLTDPNFGNFQDGVLANGGDLTVYKIQQKYKYDLQPKWEDEKFQTGGRKFLTFAQAQDFKKKLQGLSSSMEYKVVKVGEDEKLADGGSLYSKATKSQYLEKYSKNGNLVRTAEQFDSGNWVVSVYSGVDVSGEYSNEEFNKKIKKYFNKYADGGSLPFMTDPNFGDFQNTVAFELGGAFMTTDLAGNTGGGTLGLNANMPLSGVSGTHYTGLVGETGAMSSGELFMHGGAMAQNQQLIDGASQNYVITESFGNPAQQLGMLAKGGSLKNAKELSEDGRFELKVLQGLSGFNNGLNINGLYESIGFSNYRFNQYATESQVQKVEKALNSLIEKGFVDKSGLGYELTQKGADYRREFDFGSYAKGGAIKNQYEGRTAEDVWKNWTEAQRSHFLLDHSELLDNDRMENNLGYTRTVQKDKTFSELTAHTKRVLEAHVRGGQYAKGGAFKDVDDNLYVSISKTEDDYWVITSKPTTKEQAEEMARLVTSVRGETEDVKTVGQVKAHSKTLYADGGSFAPNVADGTQFMNGVYAKGGGIRSQEELKRIFLEKEAIVKNLTPKQIAEMWNKNSYGVKQGISKPMTVEEAKNSNMRIYLENLLIENELTEDEQAKYFADGGFTPNVADGTQFMNGVYADGGAINGMLNKKIQKLAEKKGLTMDALGRDKYNKLMTQALVESLTDANFHDEAKQVVVKAEGKTKWSDELYQSESFNPDEEVGSFAREVARECDYDGDDIVNAYFFVTKMQGSKVGTMIEDMFLKNKAKNTSSSKPKKYVDHDDIESVTLNVNGNFVTFSGKDFLNGANLMEKGGDLSKIATYFPIRDIVKVTLKNGDTVKPLNGYWLKKGSEPMGKKNITPKIDETKAHFQADALGNVFVDSNFVNQSQNNLPNTELKHLGFGEFYLETPDGNIDFIRTSEEKQGFVGRSHKMKGNDELVLKLVNAMKEKGRFESTQTFKKGGRVSVNWGGHKSKENWGKNDLYEMYANSIDLDADLADYFKDYEKDFGKEKAEEEKKRLIETLVAGKIKYSGRESLTFANGGEIQGNNIDSELEDFDLDNLDPYETMQYNNFVKSSGKVGALQILINTVEGDYTQLSPELAELAEMQMSSEEYDEATRQMRFERDGYANGGEIRRFNRQEQMDSKTREEVLDVLSEPKVSGVLTNYLYGLFDGYDYSETEDFKKELSKLKSKDSALYDRVNNIYKIIDKYKFEKYDEYADGGSTGSGFDPVKVKVVLAVGFESAMEFYDAEYPIRPIQLLQRAVRGGYITLDEINERVVDSAMETAQDTEDMEEVGSSDFGAYLRDFLDEAGFKVGYVNGRLTREYADGGFMNNVYADGGVMAKGGMLVYLDGEKSKSFKTKKSLYEFVRSQTGTGVKKVEIDYGNRIIPTFDTYVIEDGKLIHKGELIQKNYNKEDAEKRRLETERNINQMLGYADGGNIADFTDNQQMIMNQNVELEHHHEELEDILEDEMPVPAWVVAKMATATQSISDVTHYLDGQKELMEDEDEIRSSEFFPVDEENEEEDDDQEAIKNQTVVEPINVTAGTKAEITKNFTDDAMGNLRGFLKGMEGIDLRDDYTFDYKDEQYEVEPIINSDENGVSNAVFSIFDGDGEEVGEVAYSREGGKQKFTANSEFFSWNNAKFEDGGYFDGTIPKVSTYMSTYDKGGETEKYKTLSFKTKAIAEKNKQEIINHFGDRVLNTTILNGVDERGNNGFFVQYNLKKENYAKGGEIAKAEILGLKKNFMGTTDIEMKITGMRKSQDFIVYPIGKDDSGDIITIQSETRIGKIDLSTGRGLMSQSHSNGAYFVHFQMDRLTPFTLNESDLEELKMHIFRTAGDNVGSRGIVSDNSGASRLFANGGFMNDVYADGGDVTTENYEKRLQYLKMMKNNERTDLGKYKIDKEIREINTILEHRVNLKNSYAKGGMVVSSIKDIPNFTERLEQRRITYRGLGMGKVADDFYKLAGTSGTRIKVDGKEYFITDEEFNTFSRDANGKMQIRFDAPARKNENGGFMNDVYAKGGTLKKYILKADIKTVTVKRGGKEVTYKSADVLNGANVLAKGGDISSKANYIPKRDVVEVELNDGSKVKPVNGYWVKKGAEPIGAEPTPTSSGSSETKIGTTQIRKDMRGNWRAETNIDNFNGYDWRLSTVKTYSGNLVSSAQGGKTEATGTKGIVMFKYAMYQDPNHTLEVSKPKRLTDKVVTEQHDKALTKFKKFMETGMFKGGGKISNFDKLSDKVAKEYEGKPVKGKYQEEYGKYYSKEEAQEVGDKVAGKMKLMTADKKAFGGLFGGAKSLVTKPKFPELDGKQVALKSGKYVQVFSQSGSNLTVLDLGKIGTGERPYKIDISEVDMNSFKAGGNVAGKRANRGTETLKKANELAKKIRKDGESWLDAKKRAFAQLKSV